MANRPPFDRDAPPPGGFNPRYDARDRDEGPRLRRDDPRSRMDEEDPFAAGPRDRARPVGRGGMPRSTLILLVLGGLLLLGAIIFGLSLGRSGAGDDKLGANAEGQETSEAAAADPGARCASPATADLLKRELFRQASATRGSDQAVFDQLAGYSALRVSGPVLREKDEGLERVSCGASLALDLPPGVAVVGGRRTLTASVTYDLQPATDSSGDVLVLRGAEGITVPLATLARSGSQPAPVPIPAAPVTDEAAPSEPAPEADPAPPPPVPAEPAPVTSAARPSFNCARARTSGEIAVCQSDSLAALDRQMASFYVTALRDADPAQRALLQRTRDRFLAFRDRCGNDRCIADAYRGRISEIRDIVDGRWRGN